VVGCSEPLGLVMGVVPEGRGRDEAWEEPLGRGEMAGVDIVRCSGTHTRHLVQRGCREMAGKAVGARGMNIGDAVVGIVGRCRRGW
jgi:hypothetical protein